MPGPAGTLTPTRGDKTGRVSRRIDYLDDPNAPAPNSLVPSVNVIVVNDASTDGSGELLEALRADGRIEHHPVFPDATQGPAARRIASDADVRDVIKLFRINYSRATAARS